MKITLLALAALLVPALTLGFAGPASATAVHPKVSAAASHTTIYLGSSVTVHGSVSPNQHGHTVYLERYYSRSWHKLGHKALTSKSAYSFTTKPSRTGSWTYRAYEYRTKTRAAAASRTIRVTVKTKPRPASCHPRASSGNCYKSGQFCPANDHGKRGVAGNGKAIKCEYSKKAWRWVSV